MLENFENVVEDQFTEILEHKRVQSPDRGGNQRVINIVEKMSSLSSRQISMEDK